MNSVVSEIRHLNFEGNIIPHSWYSKITFENGKTDLVAIVILAEIVYWYRPTEVKCERSGKLLGFKKKFKADMLQRNIASFSNQFGISKRQAADALKRLETSGLIKREMRTVDTHHGKLGNVQYLEPIVLAIKMLDDAPTDNQVTSEEIVEDRSFLSISYDHINDATPTTLKRNRGGVETEEDLRLNKIGPTLDRSTYTKNTTKITTEKTAAEKQGSMHKPVSTKSKFAAASLSKNSLLRKTLSVKKDDCKLSNNSLIGEILSTDQRLLVERVAKSLSGHLGYDQKILADEIEYVILSKTSFTQANNDFSKKLNTIKKYIKQQGWSTPVGMRNEEIRVEKSKNNIIKQSLKEAEMDYQHWNKLFNWATDIRDERKIKDFQKLLNQAKQNLILVKKKINSMVDKPNIDNLEIIS